MELPFYKIALLLMFGTTNLVRAKRISLKKNQFENQFDLGVFF